MKPKLIDGDDGNLYSADGSTIVRTEYKGLFSCIETGRQLRATLRLGNGGSYPIVIWTASGEAMLPSALATSKADLRREIRSIRDKSRDRIIAAAAYLEGPDLECAVSGTVISSAYGDPENEDL
jgi:hypothetical protein